MTKTITNNIENPDKADVWLDSDNPHRTTSGSFPNLQDMINNQTHQAQDLMQEYNRHKRYLAEGTELKLAVVSSHLNQSHQQLVKNTQTLSQDLADIRSALIKAQTPSVFGLWQQWLSYSTDSTKRLLQTAEILKDRGDIFIEHELAGCPPVLDYDYDIILDASTFDRPCNYVLLRIKPPEGVVTEETNRPYIIIDPRAGHGAGIGGFKPESQVGVALNNGRPVYFVAFKRLPEPTQTIADVTYAEARFVREVEKRHPNSQSPVIVGNCQGGWAALILAATHPDIKGPIVMNGAPVAAWSGKIGVDPMRYKAGVNGGTWLAMMSADMNNGVFDGAWLVNNFEQMNPYRNYIGKYYDLYKNPAANRERFLDFERWWGGFFTMNEAEIRWIVENIFIGNRIARNTGQLEKGVNIDLRNVKAPIIVFASRGDDITPPPQALAWILDAYTDEKEIEVCGQRIVYMIHKQVGHLGIFVSSKVANHEHKGMASVMDMVEILPPGLYEMTVEDEQGLDKNKTLSVSVDFKRRTFDDLSEAIGQYRTDEKIFRAVHRSSKSQTRIYEQSLQPIIKAMSNETSAQILRSLHPLRLQRSLWSRKNPMVLATSILTQPFNSFLNNTANDVFDESVTDATAQNTKVAESNSDNQTRSSTTQNYGFVKLPGIEPIDQDNVFLKIEKMFMDSLSMTLDFWGDLQDKYTESMFFTIWTLPWLRQYGNKELSRRLLDKNALRDLPKVDEVLAKISQGGYPEALIRMLILANIVADNNIDRNQLVRLTEVVTKQPPFKDLTHSDLAKIIENQTLMVRFDENKSIDALTTLLKDKSERIQAFKQVVYVVGEEKNTLNPETINMLNRLKKVLDLPQDID
ncbi:DUF3141 domain-containing protein [Psychrobacter sanguinis]|uniref:DUF3141 domain-containing protein n=1 Tax=Psychrobacter sanguinis TaxID=861445 RepID=UPI00020C6084|nr:DUF3141 domain-containing protein [Psychrobacter sanguinis]EGK15406.1 hypothetical protein HMPREF9373_0100 [Psychrobacter sp. 1501(2011)]MCD9151509.1 DUF3141 domain-containing protein [Psychrobacter sanguinis]